MRLNNTSRLHQIIQSTCLKKPCSLLNWYWSSDNFLCSSASASDSECDDRPEQLTSFIDKILRGRYSNRLILNMVLQVVIDVSN